MSKRLICRYGHGHLHLRAFSCYRRLRLLRLVRARNIFVKILDEESGPRKFYPKGRATRLPAGSKSLKPQRCRRTYCMARNNLGFDDWRDFGPML
jgi:hypothetical protein